METNTESVNDIKSRQRGQCTNPVLIVLKPDDASAFVDVTGKLLVSNVPPFKVNAPIFTRAMPKATVTVWMVTGRLNEDVAIQSTNPEPEKLRNAGPEEDPQKKDTSPDATTATVPGALLVMVPTMTVPPVSVSVEAALINVDWN